MVAPILIVDDDPADQRCLGGHLRRMGYDSFSAAESPRALALARKRHPGMIVLDMNLRDGRAANLCRALHLESGTRDIPILALSDSERLRSAERLFRLGASDYLARPFSFDEFGRKVRSMVEMKPQRPKADPLPPDLQEAVDEMMRRSRQLGDVAEVHAGISPRDKKWRRYAPPTSEWAPVLEDNRIEPFHAQAPDVYYRMDRAALLRLPTHDEYRHPEKVVLRRDAPPMVAAVDTSGAPIGATLYAIVPATGLRCGTLACLLNSRLMTFFLHRVRPLPSPYIRREQILGLPIVLPGDKEQQRFESIARRLSAHSQMGGPGKAPLRASLLHEMNAAIFALFGWTPRQAKQLKSVHF